VPRRAGAARPCSAAGAAPPHTPRRPLTCDCRFSNTVLRVIKKVVVTIEKKGPAAREGNTAARAPTLDGPETGWLALAERTHQALRVVPLRDEHPSSARFHPQTPWRACAALPDGARVQSLVSPVGHGSEPASQPATTAVADAVDDARLGLQSTARHRPAASPKARAVWPIVPPPPPPPPPPAPRSHLTTPRPATPRQQQYIQRPCEHSTHPAVHSAPRRHSQTARLRG
jgi:hypothetical protein